MTFKSASFIILFWGICMLLAGGLAYYFMGSFAYNALVLGLVAAVFGFSTGHFLNRGHKQAFILALAACLLMVFLFGWLVSLALSQEQNLIFTDALAANSSDIFLLASSGMLTGTVFTLLLLLFFSKTISASFNTHK